MPPQKPARRISRQTRYRLRWRQLRKRLEWQALAARARTTTTTAPQPSDDTTTGSHEQLRRPALPGQQHLPGGLGPRWHFHFETTANRAGVCRHAAKTIAMAVSYALRAGWPDIRDTLLREIGCSTERCTTLTHGAGRWIARCARAARGSGTA